MFYLPSGKLSWPQVLLTQIKLLLATTGKWAIPYVKRWLKCTSLFQPQYPMNLMLLVQFDSWEPLTFRTILAQITSQIVSAFSPKPYLFKNVPKPFLPLHTINLLMGIVSKFAFCEVTNLIQQLLAYFSQFNFICNIGLLYS